MRVQRVTTHLSTSLSTSSYSPSRIDCRARLSPYFMHAPQEQAFLPREVCAACHQFRTLPLAISVFRRLLEDA